MMLTLEQRMNPVQTDDYHATCRIREGFSISKTPESWSFVPLQVQPAGSITEKSITEPQQPISCSKAQVYLRELRLFAMTGHQIKKEGGFFR